MYSRASAPQSIGGVLDAGIRLYRTALPSIWPISLSLAICLAIPQAMLGVGMLALSNGTTAVLAPAQALQLYTSPQFWLSYLVATIVFMALYVALIYAIDRRASGEQPTYGEALRVALALFPQAIAVAILFGLMIGIGTLLLLVPGIYLWGVYQLVFVIVAVERPGVGASFTSSRRLLKGHWWRATTIVSVAVIIILVMAVVASALQGLLVGVLGMGSLPGLLGREALMVVFNTLIVPLTPAVSLALYYDLKLRLEGGDLAARVDAIPAR